MTGAHAPLKPADLRMGLIRMTMFAVWACFTIVIASTIGGGVEDTLYQIDFEQLFQSVELNLRTDHDETSRYAPWSFKPVCTQTLPSINSELCVYTNATFANGRGISLFSTPRIAEQMANLSPFNDRDGFSPLINTDSGAWYTQPIRNKGIGMFAKHPLRRGDLIIATTPVLVAYSENLLSPAERERFLQTAIEQLPASTREAYLGLTTVHGNPEILVQDIAAANTFAIQLHGQKHLAAFPEPSRLNHDCAPNAQFHIDTATLTHYVRAVRPIAADEEISIAYTNPLDTYAQRQRYLRQSFGFECPCARCRRGGESGDAALEEINALQASLGDWTAESKASVAQAERLIQMYQDQGLDGYLDPAYCHAALMYSSVGSVKGARKYVDLAVEAIELRLGSDANQEDLSVWKEMRRDPSRHWSWKARKKQSGAASKPKVDL
ncbi:hypothetical protein LTR99_007827 [Exophiala xenobiotica]|uniref:SET domain-containing protein n=1 Tax=Vermiconidia calcicola TaxID=1690605 RepID=A0AAV9Q4P8_9PEZI|nr:hypothetical protein LTR47_002446 [Exophiala xenobiotica]KAK5534798.1 hypothetical protein LTR23_008729 [Chaetothyriales sp. CCFEE 6169]KAK5535203.1 hypothetical protein LTR25_006211 [Vermiconidia calcicola]KAK5252277.1 hypothetical protein LTS06_003144 [Exophiala xenobiotica]KAK5298138.1 hypothetical protein LTR99_007827 [Exophiala xenobiotica]